jgi:hypothetical protein
MTMSNAFFSPRVGMPTDIARTETLIEDAFDAVETAIDAAVADIAALEAQVGVCVLASLTTDDKTGLGPALNEVDANADLAQAAVDAIASGFDTILNGQVSKVVAVGAEFNGKYAVVSFAETPTAATKISSAAVADGNLTITIDQDNTADLLVSYFIDARA